MCIFCVSSVPSLSGTTTDLVTASLCVCMCGSWWRWGCVTYTWTAQYTLTSEGLKSENESLRLEETQVGDCQCAEAFELHSEGVVSHGKL